MKRKTEKYLLARGLQFELLQKMCLERVELVATRVCCLFVFGSGGDGADTLAFYCSQLVEAQMLTSDILLIFSQKRTRTTKNEKT